MTPSPQRYQGNRTRRFTQNQTGSCQVTLECGVTLVLTEASLTPRKLSIVKLMLMKEPRESCGQSELTPRMGAQFVPGHQRVARGIEAVVRTPRQGSCLTELLWGPHWQCSGLTSSGVGGPVRERMLLTRQPLRWTLSPAPSRLVSHFVTLMFWALGSS